MKKTIFGLIALICISVFFSCRKDTTFFGKEDRTQDSLSRYEEQLKEAQQYWFAGQYDSSTCLVQLVLMKLPHSKEAIPLKSVAYNLLGCNEARTNQTLKAITFFKKSYFYSIQCGKIQNIPDLYINMADAFAQSGDFVNGIAYYRKALSLSDSLNIPELKRYAIYYGLGQTYLELRDFEQSNYYYELAGQQYDLMIPYEQYHYLNNRGTHYFYKGDYPISLSFFQKARILAESHPEMSFERNLCKINQGELYLKLGKLDSTEILLSECYPFFEKSQNISCLYYIETLQIQLALRRGELAKAFKLLNKPTETKFIIPAMYDVRQKSLQTYYEEIGDYREALRYLKANNKLEDSIRNERVANRVIEIDLRYKQDTTLLKKTLLIQRQQDEMSEWKWLVVTCVALFLSSVMAVLYFRKKKDYLQVKYQNRVIQLQMENIRNRIFPHFIFNTLMGEIATYEEQDSHRHRLQKLLILLKKTLKQTENLALTLRQELDFVQSYVDWERFGFDEQFEFTIEIDSKTDSDTVYLLPMMIQLPVENAIKHALRGKKGKKELIVKVYQTEKRNTIIRIQDNGPGFGVQAIGGAPHHTGTGLRVLTQTIQLLNSMNKEEIYFHVSNLTDSDRITGCQVEIMIPRLYSYQLKK